MHLVKFATWLLCERSSEPLCPINSELYLAGTVIDLIVSDVPSSHNITVYTVQVATKMVAWISISEWAPSHEEIAQIYSTTAGMMVRCLEPFSQQQVYCGLCLGQAQSHVYANWFILLQSGQHRFTMWHRLTYQQPSTSPYGVASLSAVKEVQALALGLAFCHENPLIPKHVHLHTAHTYICTNFSTCSDSYILP